MGNGNFNGISPVLFETETNVTATLGPNSPELGARMTRNGADYLFVYNDGTNQSLTTGYVVHFATGITGYSVAITSVTQSDWPIGLVVETIPTGYYGWVMTRGFHTFECTGTINVAATPLMLGVGGQVSTGIGGHTTPIIGHLRQTTTGGSGYGYFAFPG